MSMILLCLCLFCEKSFYFVCICFVNIILFRLYLFCDAAVLLSCCFTATKVSNHHLRLSSGSTISKQRSRWSSGHPTSFDAAVQIVFELMFAWMPKGYGNPDGVSFWLGLHFLCPAQFLAELVHPHKRNQLRPSTPAQLCGSSC